MCNTCKQNNLNTVFESILHGEYETEVFPELEFELLSEINRKRKEYIKWIQASLNKILNITLDVDGIIGKYTKSAIRSFQSKNRLTVDGIVGPITEAALLKAGASAPQAYTTTTTVVTPVVSATGISTLRSNIVKVAVAEWVRWDYGRKTEDDSLMKNIIINDYWKKGTNFYNPEKGFDPWSGAFVSYVIRQAGAGKAFRYSSSHATYSYYSKLNRLANTPGTFMAYHISEIKPLPGDIIVAERNNSGLSYDTLSTSHRDGHGDIIVEITTAGVYVIGGNVGNSGSGKKGVTVNKKRMIALSADGYLTGSDYDIIIRAGGAAASEIRQKQNELELQEEFKILFQNELFNETINRKTKDYIKWIQQSLNQLLGLSLSVDGVAGVNTRSAIRSFQNQNGLTADGVVGPITERAIYTALSSGSATTTTPASTVLAGPTINWTAINKDQRILYVMERLINNYGFPINGAAGLVGNLVEESAVLPNRIEGSNETTPMIAKDFSGQIKSFTATEVMNRSYTYKRGPKLAGVGLAQWTYAPRRLGLFKHSYQGNISGAAILFDMDAQVDYLVAEMRSGYRNVYNIITNSRVSVDDASDEVVYNYETPGSVLDANNKKLPRSNSQVQTVFIRRRKSGQKSYSIYRAAHP